MIYFDNAATTYPKPESVYKVLDVANRNYAFNAGRGQYEKANEAYKIIEETRKLLCEKANSKYTIFTPSATHAINHIIAGLDLMKGDVVYCSPYDHNAILRCLNAYQKIKGIELKIIPVKDNLEVDIEMLKLECVNHRPKAIFCTHVSNVTGYVLPIKEIAEVANSFNSIFVVDGAQAFALVPIDISKMGIDYYVFAGHKTLYGPFGIAGYFTNTDNLKCSFFGGTGSDSLNLEMPSSSVLKYEASSPNVVAISGLNEAVKWAFSHDVLKHEQILFNYAIKRLQELDEVTLYIPHGLNTGIISFNLEGYTSEDLATILSSDFNISVRGGYHCSAFIHDFLGSKKYLGTVRISFSYFNTTEEIDILIEALESILYE